MKKLTKTMVSALTTCVMLVGPILGITNNVYASSSTWTDSTGDVFVYEESTITGSTSYRITAVTDNGDGILSCPATIDGTPVTSFSAHDPSGYTSSVTTIDISLNPNLICFDCTSEFFVNSLTVGTHNALKVLGCGYTSLNTIDISGCPNLSEFSCCKSSINTLDIRRNPYLIYAYKYGELTQDDSYYIDFRSCADPSGVFCSLYTNTDSNVIIGNTMYRLYNPNSGEHFYTVNVSERDNLISAGWRYEGEAWTAPALGNPVYRVYNRYTGDHHYTINYSEVQNLVNNGWTYEGICWYTSDNTGVPLYRLYNPYCRTAGSHHYTTSTAERDRLISLGWRSEGIGWYGI